MVLESHNAEVLHRKPPAKLSPTNVPHVVSVFFATAIIFVWLDSPVVKGNFVVLVLINCTAGLPFSTIKVLGEVPSNIEGSGGHSSGDIADR